MTSSGKLFQTLAPAVWKALLPIDSWQTEKRNVKLIRQCRSQPSSVRHVRNILYLGKGKILSLRSRLNVYKRLYSTFVQVSKRGLLETFEELNIEFEFE